VETRELADSSGTVEEVEDLLRYDARAALARAREVLDAGGLDPNTPLYQRWLLAKGSAQAGLGDTEDGARIMREVKSWAEEHDETTLLARSHRRLSALFRRIGDPALMLEHAVTAVDLLAEDVDDAVRADHLLGLADALGASGSYDDSIRRYHEASSLSDACGDRWLQLAVLNNLAYTQCEAGLAQEAVATAERLQREYAADGAPLRTHEGDTIARAYSLVGRFADAAAVIEPLIEETDSGQDCDGLVLALLTLAEVRRRSGDFDAAQFSLDRASRLAEHYALTGRMIEVLREQAELYAARDQFRDAFETFRDFHRADMEMRAMERDGRARTLNAIFEATEARRSSDYFRELSVRDPLTGLHNRRHLDGRLSELLEQSVLDGTRLTVGLVDLDHFKRINDTRSHAVGDEVLRRVAALLQSAAEEIEGGIAARMGGEEFLVLLPGLEREHATQRLDELRLTIEKHGWDDVSEGIKVTASIGVASSPADEVDRKALLALADANLYRAKDAGRNRVIS
jgi:two-component system cell cycle response regulator